MKKKYLLLLFLLTLCCAGCAAKPGVESARETIAYNDGVRENASKPRLATEIVLLDGDNDTLSMAQKIIDKVEASNQYALPLYTYRVNSIQSMEEYLASVGNDNYTLALYRQEQQVSTAIPICRLDTEPVIILGCCQNMQETYRTFWKGLLTDP